MKKIKMNLFALIAVAIAAVTMSFKLAVSEPAIWHYVGEGTEDGDFSILENWDEGAGSCGPIGDKPCDIEVPENMSLEDVVAGKTNSYILGLNPGSRKN